MKRLSPLNGRKQRRTWSSCARAEASGPAARVELLDGDVATALVDYAREAEIDLVVMTTHGRSGLTRWTLGSVADRVAQGGAPAILLVRVDSR